MDAMLIATGFAMGAASSPHCIAMCGAPCASLTCGDRRAGVGFHLGRIAGYAVGGAVVAGGAASIFALAAIAPVLRPIWLLVHLLFIGLGLWWIFRKEPGARVARSSPAAESPVHVVRFKPRTAGAAGLAWVLWPCGMLQGALLFATLASGWLAGALIMAAFAMGSLPALVSVAGLAARRHLPMARMLRPLQGRGARRLAGIGLVATSGWALADGAWQRIADLCLT